MLFTLVLPIIRHALTTAAGALVAKGLVDASMSDQVVGALMTLSTVAWSIIEKMKATSVVKK